MDANLPLTFGDRLHNAWMRVIEKQMTLRIRLLLFVSKFQGKTGDNPRYATENYYLSEDYANYARKLERIYCHTAWLSEPKGRTCHFCGKPNDNADDCGYCYINDPREAEKRDEKGWLQNESYPACKACYEQHSWLHHKRYGVGER